LASSLRDPSCGGEEADKTPDASVVIVDSQSMKTTEEGAGSTGYDAHKNVKGRKRQLLVDTLGLPLSIYVNPAEVQDRVGARLLLAGLGPLVPRLKKIWANSAYSGKELAKWCEEQGEWELEIVERHKEAEGFEVLPKRWIVERIFGWLRRDQRLAKDYERKGQISETLIEVAIIRLIFRRLARAA
jgi:putative transposase